MNDEMNDLNTLKQRAECTEWQAQTAAPSGTIPQQANARRRTLSEQAEENSRYHTEQADKHYRAAAFLRENPQFDEFIQLVRSGAIRF